MINVPNVDIRTDDLRIINKSHRNIAFSGRDMDSNNCPVFLLKVLNNSFNLVQYFLPIVELRSIQKCRA